MNTPIILIFGNPLLKQDSLPIKILPKLTKQFPNISFQEIDPTENLEPFIQNKTLNIIDTVEGIKEPIIITNIDQLQTNKLYSMHDFDLGYNLKLLKKIGKIDNIKIIGLPMEINEDDAMDGIKEYLEGLLDF